MKKFDKLKYEVKSYRQLSTAVNQAGNCTIILFIDVLRVKVKPVDLYSALYTILITKVLRNTMS